MKVSELLKPPINEGLISKIKAFASRKKNDQWKMMELEELTPDDRKFISKHIKHNNADIKFNNTPESRYVLPTNVTAYSGRGRINFYKHNGVIHADVGYYNSSSDAENMKVSPIVIFDVEIKSDADMLKLKDDLK